MKPTKVRNYQIYRAPLHRRSAQLGSTLSEDLRKKYGKRSARVVEGDTVKVLRGEYKDVEGKVSSVLTLQNSVAIEGIKKEKGKGDKFDVLIHTSNLMITNLNTDDNWRTSKLEGKKQKSKKEHTETKTEEKTEEKKLTEEKTEEKKLTEEKIDGKKITKEKPKPKDDKRLKEEKVNG